MVASPADLWDSYLHALDAAPLLTKVWTRTMVFFRTKNTTHVVTTAVILRKFARAGELFKGVRFAFEDLYEDLHTYVTRMTTAVVCHV